MINEELRLLFLAVLIVGAVFVLMHERHYQSRREKILEARVRTLEEIIGESRNS